MPRLTAGEAIVRSLIAHGVDTVFGLPGAQMYPLWDALQRLGDQVRTLSTRHEQGAGYMALGYAKATGRPGVYTVVPGPGVLNTTAALCTAWGCNTPVLCLTGQVPSAFLGQGRGHLHELPDQLATLATLVKHARRIDRPQDVLGAVAEAFRAMQSGRPGPASLEMCWDTLGETADVELPGPLPPAAGSERGPEPDPDAVAEAARLIAGARHPMIMVGGGAQHAAAEVLALAERLGAPVTAFRSGRGIVAEDHPLGVSSVAAHRLWADTDLLIGIGSRLELQTMRWTGMMRRVQQHQPPPHLIRVEIDPAELERLRPQVGILADAAEGARALTRAVERAGVPGPADLERISAAKRAATAAVAKVQPHVGYLQAIRDVLPRDGFFVEELCQAGFASYFAFPVYEPRTYVTPGFQGTLGFGYPTALGVKAACPERAVVSINGDGGFGFNLSELATAVQERLGVVAVVFNNGAYGNVQRDQVQRYEGRVLGAGLTNPDFVKLAESFGVRGERVDSPAALRPALERALAADAPALIEVIVDPASEVSPWEFIHPAPPPNP